MAQETPKAQKRNKTQKDVRAHHDEIDIAIVEGTDTLVGMEKKNIVTSPVRTRWLAGF